MKKIFVSACMAMLVFYACTPPRSVSVPPPPKEEPALPPRPVPPPPEKEIVRPAPVNVLSNAEKAAGWTLLFDGTTTDGWHTYGSKSIGAAWKASNGNLCLDAESKKQFKANTGGDIVTDEEFGNFELQLDWKVAPKGNSGIVFYIKEDRNKYPAMWHTGPEMQILDNNGHADGRIAKHRAGDLYDLMASASEPVKPTGEWNHVRIRSVNGKLDFYLNGVHIINTTLWNDNWRAMIAGSKFASMPDFGTFRKGRIGLQDHGDDVWFRNIKILRL